MTDVEKLFSEIPLPPSPEIQFPIEMDQVNQQINDEINKIMEPTPPPPETQFPIEMDQVNQQINDEINKIMAPPPETQFPIEMDQVNQQINDEINKIMAPTPPPLPTRFPNIDPVIKCWALALDTGCGSRMNLLVFRNITESQTSDIRNLAIKQIIYTYQMKAKKIIPLVLHKKLPDSQRILVAGFLFQLHKKLLAYFLKKTKYDIDDNEIAKTPHIILKEEDQLVSSLKSEINLIKDWIK